MVNYLHLKKLKVLNSRSYLRNSLYHCKHFLTSYNSLCSYDISYFDVSIDFHILCNFHLYLILSNPLFLFCIYCISLIKYILFRTIYKCQLQFYYTMNNYPISYDTYLIDYDNLVNISYNCLFHFHFIQCNLIFICDISCFVKRNFLNTSNNHQICCASGNFLFLVHIHFYL